MSADFLKNYDSQEENLNVWSHGFGALLALLGGLGLVIKGSDLPTAQWIGLWVYGLSLLLLFSASTLYHMAKTQQRRFWYKKLDHTAIYYLIAGTYTPFLAIAIPTEKAKILLIALWMIAALGTVFKLIFIHRFQKVSLIAYLVMGWLAILVMDDMQTYLDAQCLNLIIAGGLAYTIGALFYALKRVRYTHAIWHVFVLIGAGLQFWAVFEYVI
jgi:hemolysin III